jgi:small subunit ribosomal protein S18
LAKKRSTSSTSTSSRRPRPSSGPGGWRRKSCHFCRDKVDRIDYKDFQNLRRYLSDRGKIRSRRITGACRRHQSQLANAVKRARELALLPYVSGAPEGTSSGRRERQ